MRQSSLRRSVDGRPGRVFRWPPDAPCGSHSYFARGQTVINRATSRADRQTAVRQRRHVDCRRPRPSHVVTRSRRCSQRPAMIGWPSERANKDLRTFSCPATVQRRMYQCLQATLYATLASAQPLQQQQQQQQQCLVTGSGQSSASHCGQLPLSVGYYTAAYWRAEAFV